mmetsp:Transcript_5054/g.12158  ORF Transcript_5054/g.12158 Transcript_5054/m.12158 type:complete len:216 (-) Transcript_5054:2163-2810(-)
MHVPIDTTRGKNSDVCGLSGRARRVASVFECGPRELEEHSVLRIHHSCLSATDAPESRVELVSVQQQLSLPHEEWVRQCLRRDALGCKCVCVERGESIFPCAQHAPKVIEVLTARKPARHPNYGDLDRPRVLPRAQVGVVGVGGWGDGRERGDVRSELANGCMCVQVKYRESQSESCVERRHELSGGERMAPQIEEVIVRLHLLQLQLRCPHLRE